MVKMVTHGQLTELLAITQTNLAGVSVGSPVACDGWYGARVIIKHALVEATAMSDGAEYSIQGSIYATGTEDNYWEDLLKVGTGRVTAAVEAFAATEPIAETVIAAASTTGFSARGEKLFILHTTLALSEWVVSKSLVANTSITLRNGIINAHAAADSTLYTQAEEFSPNIILSGIKRIRLVVDNNVSATGSHIVSAVNVLPILGLFYRYGVN